MLKQVSNIFRFLKRINVELHIFFKCEVCYETPSKTKVKYKQRPVVSFLYNSRCVFRIFENRPVLLSSTIGQCRSIVLHVFVTDLLPAVIANFTEGTRRFEQLIQRTNLNE